MAGVLDIAAGDIGKRQTAVQDLYAQGEDVAFDKLLDFARDFGSRDQAHDAIVISNEFSEYRRAARRNDIDLDQFMKYKKNIGYRLLDLLDDIVSQYQLKLAA